MPAAILLFIVFNTDLSGQSMCDPDLTVPPGRIRPEAYQDRDRRDRCEGFYWISKSTSVPELEIVSFTALKHVDTRLGNDIQVRWSAPRGEGSIHLSVRSVDPDVPYAMDTQKPAANRRYAWPVGFLSSHRISAEQIGIVGRIYHSSYRGRGILLPLVLTQGQSSVRSDRYCLQTARPYPLASIAASITRAGERQPVRRWALRSNLGSVVTDCFRISGLAPGVYELRYDPTYVSIGGQTPRPVPLRILFFVAA